MRHTAKELQKNLIETEVTDIKECIPVKHIRNGIIKKSNGRYVKIIEINPINFHLRSAEEQNRVVSQFWSWVNGAPDRFQINIRMEEGSTHKLMENVKREVNNSKSLYLLQRGYDRMDMLQSVTKTGLLNKRYFISYEYDHTLDEAKNLEEKAVAYSMDVFKDFTSSRFQYMDCSVKKHDDDNEFLQKTLYEYYNPKSCIEEPFEERKKRIDADWQRLALEGKPDCCDYIGSRAYNTSNPDFLYMDGKFHTFLFIRDNGYPLLVTGGWVDVLTRFGKNVSNVAMHFKRERKEGIIHITERSMNLKRSAIRTTASGKKEKQKDIAIQVSDTEYLHDALKHGGQEFFWVNTIITIMADSYGEMNRIKREIMRELRSAYGILLKSCGYHYEEAFKMSLPLCYDANEIKEICKRNFLTESIAGMFPFSSYSLYSPVGVPIAYNLSNQSIVAPDFFDTGIFTNPNILLLGMAGAGKTYTELILGYCYRLIGIQCMYVLPTKGYEYERATIGIGGNFIKFGPGTANCINFLEIRPEKDVNSSLMEGEVNKPSYLSKKMTVIKTIFQLLMREQMTVLEENRLDEELIKLYADFGITSDNESIWLDKEKGLLKKMPIPEDLYERIKNHPDLKIIASCLTVFVNGSCKNMNGQTNIDLMNKFIVFDVDSEIIDKRLHPVFLFIAIDFCYSRAKENRGERCMVFMDEVWKMMVQKMAAEFVFEMTKLIRGYGSGVVIATQDISDFMMVENASMNESILNNCATKIILKMEKTGLKLVESQLELNRNEKEFLQRVDIGQALIMAGKDRVPVQFLATQREHELFTTNPKDLEYIRNKKGENTAYV